MYKGIELSKNKVESDFFCSVQIEPFYSVNSLKFIVFKR